MKVTINQKALLRIQSGHPWIFRSDLSKVEKEEAGVCTVVTGNGRVLGQGLYSPKSLIALRMLTHGEERFTAETLRQRILAANQFRKATFPGAESYRVVFGEGDLLPSLIVDRFGGLLVFQTLSAGMETFKPALIEILKEEFSPRSLVERNDSPVRQKEGLPTMKQVVFGENPREFRVAIEGKSFGFDPLEGQKTGFFLDQRFNAKAAARYLRGEILDTFSYVGQFALLAADHATQLTCVDSSETAAAQLKANFAANGRENFTVSTENAFDFLKACDKEKRKFDGVCLDPPAFVKSRSAIGQALKGYKEINLRGMKLLNPGGILVTSSCSQNLKQELFESVLRECARDARRELQVLETRSQPPDHPWLLTVPETRYLKCFILRVF